MTKIKNRKSVRLQSWDYSSDAYYFVTICTQNRESIFGEIVYRKMMLNHYGTIVENVWKSLPNHHNVFLDKHQTMPNHFHGIIICTGVAMNGCTGVARNAPTRNENIFKNITKIEFIVCCCSFIQIRMHKTNTSNKSKFARLAKKLLRTHNQK